MNKDEITQLFNKAGEVINKVEELLKNPKVQQLIESTSQFGDVGEVFKLARNYQGLKKDKYTFKEVMEWFRENKPEGKYIGAVLKSKEKTEKGEEVYRLDLVFLDAETESPCMINCPYMVVRTFYLDPELNDLFRNKDFLILK